jgi:hypothetical protein
VVAVTGTSIDDWAKGTQSAGEAHSRPAAANRHDLVALLKQAGNLFVKELQERINVGATSPRGIELGAGFSRERVLTAYADLLRRLGGYCGGIAGRPTHGDAPDQCPQPLAR